MSKAFLIIAITVIAALPSLAQGPAGSMSQDPVAVGMSIELTKISRSVSAIGDSLKEIAEKAGKPQPTATGMTAPQQKLVFALQLLTNAEQLLAARQKFQIELVEKQGTSRTRLAQVERDLMPTNIDRAVQFEGTTKTEELRDNRRSALAAERTSLQALLAQINSNLMDTNDAVREAQALVQRLRRQVFPDLERELNDRP